jgi:uncharacterized protein
MFDGRVDQERSPATSARRGPVTRMLLAAVHAYQRLRAGRPSPCRYFPSCSAYAVEALEVHGGLRGSGLAARRLARCHPWGGHGIDLVPPPRSVALIEKKAP